LNHAISGSAGEGTIVPSVCHAFLSKGEPMILRALSSFACLALAAMGCASAADPSDVASTDVEVEPSSSTPLTTAGTVYSKTYGYCVCWRGTFYCDPTPWDTTNGDESFRRCLSLKTCC
jgi:hypothetical protein